MRATEIVLVFVILSFIWLLGFGSGRLDVTESKEHRLGVECLRAKGD